MTTGRSRLLASLALAVGWGLLVVFSFPGCSLNREYVRRGAVLDSAAARIYRLEQAQVRQGDELQLLRAQLLTELEGIGGQLDQVTAQLEDLTGRLDRPARRVPPAPDTVAGTAARPDTGTRQAGGMDPDKLYSTAYLDFTRGRYDLAIPSFRRFIELFPDSDNADNAQYWVGESFYSLGQLDSAEAELRVVIAGYPDGNKVPSALYKLALLYQQTGRENAARSQLDRIVRDFPGSNEAKLAAERLRTLGNR